MSFRPINSGTRSDIQSIFICEDNSVFFNSEKIYQMENTSWKRLNFPASGKISCFYPLSANDLWYTIDQVTNTSQLYHYKAGINENISPPFANQIYFIQGISTGKALLASMGEVSIFENNTFQNITPLPLQYSILKLYGSDISSFWVLSANGSLFFYRNGTYEKILGDKKVENFCFNPFGNGYIISGDELYHAGKAGLERELVYPDLRKVNAMKLLDDGTVLMAGKNGLFLRYLNGRIVQQELHITENLNGIAANSSDEIWICGENGRLLYHGNRDFPPYIENNQGFSSHKLITYNISTDDEYGVAMADFNGDSKTDIYSVRIYEQNRLYINNIDQKTGNGSYILFYEEAAKRNATGRAEADPETVPNELKLGITAGDVDNDGDQDIYLCYLNSNNKLLLNMGNGLFRNVSLQRDRACEDMKRSNAAAFSDVDNDGDLDLFVTSEEGSNRLFSNDGTGHFKEITISAGVGSEGGGMCASFADLNNDGLSDLCVTFWNRPNKIYFNTTRHGSVSFKDMTEFTGLSQDLPVKSNGITFFDINNDGATDLYIANRNEENKLYLNDGNGKFTDKTAEYFNPDKHISNGAAFADFDLDGFPDLYVTNVGDNILYKNNNGTRFSDATTDFGVELSGYCTGCVTGDVDNDGDPDLYVANYVNGNSKLFLNMTEKKSFLKFNLHGIRSNRDAIGAKIWLYKSSGTNGKGVLSGYREVNGGGGYASVSAKEVIFGLKEEGTYFAKIKFPSSADTLKIDGLVAGQTREVYELTGLKALYLKGENNTIRFFRDQENQPEIIKYLVILVMLAFFNPKHKKTIHNINLLRWAFIFFIFTVFSLVNMFFLFQWPSPLFFAAPVTALGLLAIAHLYIERILLKRRVKREKHDLREKLSRDLHDDLASTLGSVSIYAETLKGMNQPSAEDFKNLSSKITGLTQTALQSISDIIWMTAPRNDSLQSLMSKTNNYLFETLTDNKIDFRSGIEIKDDLIVLPEKIRNNVFLILKEGLHNIIRHSGAKKVEFTATVIQNLCTVYLYDNGIGISGTISKPHVTHGNGLFNMRRRALESGIDLSVFTPDKGGTTIRIQFKI